MNTVYRRPRARDGRRVPFDFDAILSSDAFKQISIARPPANPTIAPPSSSTGIIPSTRTRTHQSVRRPTQRAAQNEHEHRTDLGVYSVDEVQICLMGSSGPEGEYVSVGGIRLEEGGVGGGGGELT